MAGKPFRDRLGWDDTLRPFLYKKLPSGTKWSATLGSVSLLVFAVMAISGAFLALYYNPSPDKAFQSIDYLTTHVPMGSFLRGLHHWGAGVMVVLVFLHLLDNFFTGTYKAPRELTWIAGACLFVLTLGLGFTGYLLPWDRKGYWATVVGTNLAKSFPLAGNFLARAALGGDAISGLTLTRFYAIHLLFLPGLLVALVAFHIYLVRLHGLTEPVQSRSAGVHAGSMFVRGPEAPATPTPPRAKPARGGDPGAGLEASATLSAGAVDDVSTYRFFPEHVFRSALVFAVVFAAIAALAHFRYLTGEPIAGNLSGPYLPRPEWYYMWLFQILTYFSVSWEQEGSLAIPLAGVVLLFALPFFDRSRRVGLVQRPIAMAVGVTCLVAIAYLSWMGFEGARPYGQVVPLPDRALTAMESRGLRLFSDRECAYCHQINGQGGHRYGPDLANLAGKGRSKDYLASYVRNPQAVSMASIMPKYNLAQADLEALAEFMLALDFRQGRARLVKGTFDPAETALP